MAFLGIQKFKRAEPLHIRLPVVFTRDTVYALVKQLFLGLQQRPSKVVLDFTKLERIQVGGITMLSNMVELYKANGIKTLYRNADDCKAADFLRGAGLVPGSVKAGNSTDHFTPLTLVEYDRSHTYVEQKLVPWLAKILGHDVRALASLKVCFEEIFNNICDHSTVKVGCSAGHYNEIDGKITICISDFGIGIPRRVREAIKLGSDQAAIAMACQEGFTTKSTPRNMGAGLHILIRNVVHRNHGSVIISSGNGIYSQTYQSGGENKGTGRASPGLYPGTMIYITFGRSDFVPSEIDGEEFTWD